MPAAIIAGGVAAVGAIGGALIGSSAQKKAASQANAAEQQAAAQQYALGQQSLQLQEKLAGQSLGLNTDIYNTNYNLLSPYVSRGNVAGGAYNALLGLPAAPGMTSPLSRPGGGTYTANGGMPFSGGANGGTSGGNAGGTAPYTQAQIDAMWHDGIPGNAEAAQGVLNQWNASHSAPAAAPATAPPAAHPTTPAALMGSTAPGAYMPPPAQPNALIAPTAPQPTIQQHAQEAIAAGANPGDVQARMMQMGARM